MKSVWVTLTVSFVFFLLAAVSMGNRMYLLLSLIMALACALAYLSVRMAEKTVGVTHGLSSTKVNRGDSVSMEVSVGHKGILPIAPVRLKCAPPAIRPPPSST